MSDPTALAFVKELATYYMDFLETDFHRRRNPKRMIRFRNADNLLVGVNLARYSGFTTQVWKAVARAFRNSALDHVSKGSYRTTVPQSLLRLVELEAEKVSPSQIARLHSVIGAEIGRLARSNRSDFDAALNASLEFAAAKLASELVAPIISRLRRPLENAGLADENTLYLMEQELRDLLLEPARSKISEIVRRLVTGDAADAASELETVLDAPAVKSQVVTFFSDLAIGDLFAGLYELERNKSILEKQEFYLYFGDIHYQEIKYPVFYIPFQASIDQDRIAIEFDARVYINKRALEYIVQQENERTGKKGSLRCTKDRIIYLAQHEDDLAQMLSSHLSELSNSFALDKTIDITDPAPQIAKGMSVRLTNNCYIAVFDNSDEALLNDYEQILQMLAAGTDTPLAAAFTRLVDDFIHREPESVEAEVEAEWDGLSVPERLVCESPIPLNSEQRQILLALQKPRAKYITVEGPPGTGKSHTITAIVCQSVLQHQSVLVLSDKKEALDVVEDKIISTLNSVRADRQFQNPILRLGSTGSTYAQILSASVMEGIKTHFKAVKKEHEAVEQSITQTVEALREDLEAEVLAYSDIELPEIAEWARLDAHYTLSGPLVDAEELASCEDAVADLEDIRKIALLLREIGSRREPFATIAALLGFSFASGGSELSTFLARAAAAEDVLKKVTSVYPHAERRLALVSSLSGDDVDVLRGLLEQYNSLKMPVFGYLFTRRKVEMLDQQFRQRFGFASAEAPHARLTELAEVLAIANLAAAEGKRTAGPCDWVALCHRGLTVPSWRAALQQIAELADAAQDLGAWGKQYARSLAKLGVDLSDCPRLAASGLAELPEQD
ncbi:MAG: AAA domain-containing protein, partial [Bryobacterales bacterium]|nr:AAA domain-containing protein [Bryobacterales bacterium]